MMVQCVNKILVATLVMLGSLAHAGDASMISIEDAWARNSAPGAPSAGFLMIKNLTDQEDRLVNVTGDFAKKLELHQTSEVDGVMKMAHQENGIVIPANGMVMLKPGGYHLMFMGLAKNFELGETYVVELEFEKAGSFRVELPVKAAAMSTMSH